MVDCVCGYSFEENMAQLFVTSNVVAVLGQFLV